MDLDTAHLARCLQTLERSLERLPCFLEDARRLEVTLRERLGGADA